ncbi:hypothetical protein [Streptomyces parvus]|uniref:hypothetical protein n=1 Tax=Streptomyces parvus TaxID=66428 RepID=UPI00371280CF
MPKSCAPLTPADAKQLGNAVGGIIAITARALHQEFPHLSVERLVETFTRPSVIESTGLRYLSALDGGATPGNAAGQASAALVKAWAAARLRAAEITTSR